MNFTLSLPLTEDSTATIARNIYESFRMLGDALLVAKGIESKDHILPIKEIMKLDIETARPLGVLDNFRRLRHNINYYGYKPRIEEVADAVDYAKKCFGTIRKKVEEEIRL